MIISDTNEKNYKLVYSLSNYKFVFGICLNEYLKNINKKGAIECNITQKKNHKALITYR
jgi:hypothetical protein